MIYERMDCDLWKVYYQSLIWNYSVVDDDYDYVLLIYIGFLNWIRELDYCFLYKHVDQMSGQTKWVVMLGEWVPWIQWQSMAGPARG